MEQMNQKSKFAPIKNLTPNLGKHSLTLIGVAIVLLLYFWSAVVSIPPGEVGVVFRKIGDDAAVKDRCIVEKDEKGMQREVLVPGEYYLNPLAVEVDIIEAVVIPKGQVGIVTKRVGEMPVEGTILVEADDNFQGIQRQPLQPGIHYINPFEKDVKIIPAIVVADGHVGVQIAKTGKPKPYDQLLAKPGQRGILELTLSPGLYYINPYEYEVVVFDTRQQRYEMTFQEGKGDTELSDSIKFSNNNSFFLDSH